MKKRIYIIFILLLLLIKLVFSYMINEIYIYNYNNKKYNISLTKLLLFLNISEPYIAHYNYANGLYMLGDYNNAVSEYDKALNTVSRKRMCYVIANKSLAMLKLIDKNDENIKEELTEIQNVLKENNCARPSGDGKDEKSQEIYDEIEAQKEGDGEEEKPSEPDDKKDKKEEQIDVEKIKEEIEKQRIKAQRERNAATDYDYDYYNGKVWWYKFIYVIM